MKRFLIQRSVHFLLVLAALVTAGSRVPLVQAEVETRASEKSQIDPMEIQNALAEAGFYKGAIDGIIGKKTRAAIRTFQRKHGLTPDGVCGPKTWEKLKIYLEEAQEMDAVDQELTTPTVDEGSSLNEETASDPWLEPEPPSEESGELKQKLVS